MKRKDGEATHVFSLREVEAFAAFMRHGTATGAAEVLDISQPAVSKLLANFQKKAGFIVYKKYNQRLLPTQEAHLLFAEVDRVFLSLRDIARAAQDIAALRTGRLNIASLPSLGHHLLPRLLAQFAAEHPSIAVTLNVRDSQTVIEWVGRNQIDLGIASAAPIDHPGVVRRSLASVPAVCVVPMAHRLASRSQVRLRDLEGENFISFGPSDPLRIALDQACATENVRRNLHIEALLATSVISFVASGAGIAIVDALSAVTARCNEIVIVPFESTICVELSIYRPRQSQQAEIARLFTDHLVKSVRTIISPFERSSR
jgi:DNA-binding transcriptional LysR family regulator